MTPRTSPLVFQNVVARSLGISWSAARSFVEAQGYETFARDARPRTWAMAARDWDALATKLGIATPDQLAMSLQAAADLADVAADRLKRPVRRRRQ